MPVEDVGIGVGYFCCLDPCFGGDSRAIRLVGRGNVGEEKGSKAGRREGAGRLTPATCEEEDRWLEGEESMLGVSYAIPAHVCCAKSNLEVVVEEEGEEEDKKEYIVLNINASCSTLSVV